MSEKKTRIIQTISALKYLNGGAMQTLHHTDVTPKMIILAVLNGGNNIFMDVFPTAGTLKASSTSTHLARC